jgi:hypothetical protein
VPLSWNLGTLTSWNPLDHSRPVTGLLYLYLSTELCFTVFYLHFIILYNTIGMSHLNILDQAHSTHRIWAAWGLRSSGTLHNTDWLLVDILGYPIGPILISPLKMGQIGCPETSVPASQRCAISHKSNNFIYIAAEVCKHALWVTCCLWQCYVACSDIWNDNLSFNTFPCKAVIECRTNFERLSHLFMESHVTLRIHCVEMFQNSDTLV